MKQLTCGSLFAGIGGFDLGFERAGIKTIWQVEIDEYCRRVLEKHFPDAERFAAIENCCGVAGFEHRQFCPCEHLETVDILCGGFPCQDVSCAGQRIGMSGKQSGGMWAEYFRIIRELHPRFVVVENVADLVIRGLERVLSDLAKIGYDAEWTCVTAAGFAAPHIRERLFLVGYPNGLGLSQRSSKPMGRAPLLAGSHCIRPWPESETEPDVRGMVDGVPKRVDRVTHLGKSLVPQIAEWIGRRIIEAETSLAHGER